MPQTMQSLHITAGPTGTLHTVPLPVPGPDQLVIRVVCSGTNPKDWKIPDLVPGYDANSGDDVAGVVHSVGEGVWEFRPGDRVACFHEMMTPGGSFAEYALAWVGTTFRVPDGVGFEEASTIPLAAMTAALALTTHLSLPPPWSPRPSNSTPTPLVIYGGSSAVGSFAIKLALLANIHPLIAISGRATPYVESLLDPARGDAVIDYRQPPAAIVAGMRAALRGAKLYHALDAVSEHGSYAHIVQVLEPGGALAVVLPGKEYEGIPDAVRLKVTNVGAAHAGERDFAYVVFRFLARVLGERRLAPHPHEVVGGGLGGVEEALRRLKEGRASAVKYVVRIAETEGLGRGE